MIQAYQSALTALQAFSTKVQANGNNIANANTNEFKRDRVTLSSVDPNGVRAVAGKDETPGAEVYEQRNGESERVELSNVDLGKEIPEMGLNKRFYQANLKTIETVSEMTGTLLKLKS